MEAETTEAMRARIRELATPERDDFDRAVNLLLGHFDRLKLAVDQRAYVLDTIITNLKHGSTAAQILEWFESEGRTLLIALHCPAPGAGEVAFEWRTDSFGHTRHALYLGDLYVGEIQAVGKIDAPDKWRGWFMSDGDGNDTGWHPTADEARTSVESALRAALTTNPHHDSGGKKP